MESRLYPRHPKQGRIQQLIWGGGSFNFEYNLKWSAVSLLDGQLSMAEKMDEFESAQSAVGTVHVIPRTLLRGLKGLSNAPRLYSRNSYGRFSVHNIKIWYQYKLALIIKTLEVWTRLYGFTFSTDKTGVMHFCRKIKCISEPYSQQELPIYKQQQGLIFDRKLIWVPHVKQLME